MNAFIFHGTIIEESLEDKSVLKDVKILSTEIEPVKESFATPWLEQWTLHKVEITEEQADKVAQKISESIDSGHNHSWYADYKNPTWHYVIFPHRIFKIARADEDGYAKAREYGISLGIPAHQVDFSPEIQ